MENWDRRSAEVHDSDNPTISTSIQPQQHNNDTEVEQNCMT